MSSTAVPFEELAPGIGIGKPAPSGWMPIARRPLMIVVGVTGVGKSTTLARLAASTLTYTLLPDRRVLTDQLIIAHMQAADGQPVQPVTDRKRRFEYTRRYRTCFAGGMAHALAQLWIDPAQLGGLLVFDGLRGADEVGHAAQVLPNACFVVLHAPDFVRVQRLLGRNDAFDQVAVASPGATAPHGVDLAAWGMAEARSLLSAAEEQALSRLAQSGAVTAGELRAKLQIVVEERRNYDPAAAIATLQKSAPARTLVIDTTTHTPDEIAAAIVDWRAATGIDPSSNHPIARS